VLDAIGARVWLVGRAVDGLLGPSVFPLPEVPEMISPLLAVVPVQLLAYHMAVVKGINPDLFRRDEDRYAAAFKLLTL
jgi:glucosamine 6-phosphate synthetase-like amidotransferase/phosphosugar isomerase protein